MNELENAILEKLRTVIDPETNLDVIRMRLVDHLSVNAEGQVNYLFRPSSFLCPIAIPLALAIKKAVSEVNGVTSQKITVDSFIMAKELENLLNEESSHENSRNSRTESRP
jgi:metal-sulfur cluster biosynthetic enzyme